ncbi:XisH family protein [Argonema galeatum]|uniref:XisH family protein n=1 Tax=Argonema galeatum TaxID=2942762 RepID=UPI0020133648|nr:XisH family protein [Argonema galeatum]MCL1463142.1 XisH family protein [Argonema galeatum A003/A1]
MSAKDRFHDVAKKALQKDNWQITHDLLTLQVDGLTDMYVDLGAEKIIAAQKDSKKIAVEIKSFLSASTIFEFHTAIGQYINYRYALQEREPERVLYLAVPLNTYNNFFSRSFIQSVIQRSQVYLIVYDPKKEEIVQWQT